MVKISEKERLIRNFNKCGEGVKYYFAYIPDIIEKLEIPAIALAYCFQQIESGHRRALYAGLVRKYRFDTEATWEAIDKHEMFLNDFIKFYALASQKPLKNSTFDLLKKAQVIRNKVTHGQDVTSKEIWQAVSDCLQYAHNFNSENYLKSGFNVFGSLQGVTKSKSKPMVDKTISALALKGLGF
jgi:hypothetical protein